MSNFRLKPSFIYIHKKNPHINYVDKGLVWVKKLIMGALVKKLHRNQSRHR